MEPEGSLWHSQVPATCPYPELDQSSPCPQPHFLKIHLNIIHPSIPGSLKWSLSLRFPHQTRYTPLLSTHRCVCVPHTVPFSPHTGVPHTSSVSSLNDAGREHKSYKKWRRKLDKAREDQRRKCNRPKLGGCQGQDCSVE